MGKSLYYIHDQADNSLHSLIRYLILANKQDVQNTFSRSEKWLHGLELSSIWVILDVKYWGLILVFGKFVVVVPKMYPRPCEL